MRSRRGALLALLLLAVVVNLPLVHGAWQRGQLARDGVEVRARVLDTGSSGGSLGIRLPGTVGDAQVPEEERAQQVPASTETAGAALAAGSLTVRVLPGRPYVVEVVGETRGVLGVGGVLLGVTLLADLFLVLAALLAWRFAGRAPGGGPVEPEEPDDWPFHPDRARRR